MIRRSKKTIFTLSGIAVFLSVLLLLLYGCSREESLPVEDKEITEKPITETEKEKSPETIPYPAVPKAETVKKSEIEPAVPAAAEITETVKIGKAPFLIIKTPEENKYYGSIIPVKGELGNSKYEKGKVNKINTATWTLLGTKQSGIIDYTKTGFFNFNISTAGITGTLVLKINAVDIYDKSVERTITLLDKGVGPCISIESPADGNVYNSEVTVYGFVLSDKDTKSSSEVDSLSWKVMESSDNGDLTFGRNGAFSFIFSAIGLPDTIILKLSAKDKNGHNSEESITLRNDGIGPAVTVLEPEDESYYASIVNVKGRISNQEEIPGNVSEVKSLYYTLLGTEVKKDIEFTPDGIFEFSFNSEELSGLLVVELKAVDLIGNTTCRTISLLKEKQQVIAGSEGKSISDQSPFVKIISPVNMSFYTSEIKVEGIVADSKEKNIAETIQTLCWELSGTEKKGNIHFEKDGKFNFTIPTAMLQQSLVLKIKAVNKNGLEAETYTTLLDDGKGPALKVITPSNRSFYKSSVTVTGKAGNSETDSSTGEIDSLMWEIPDSSDSGSVKINNDGSFKFVVLTTSLNETLILKISAKDKNNHTTEKSIILLNDGQGPFIKITEPDDMSYFKSTVKVSGVVSNCEEEKGRTEEVKSVYWNIPGDPNKHNLVYFEENGAFIFDLNTKKYSGMQTLEINGEDMNGNITKKTIKLLDGNIPPAITIISPEDNSSYGAGVAVTGFAINPYSDADGYGKIKKLTYEVSPLEYLDGNHLPIADFIDIEPGGSFKFIFPSSDLKGAQIIKIKALAENGNMSEKSIKILKSSYNIPSFKVVPETKKVIISWDPVIYASDYSLFYIKGNAEPSESDGSVINGIKSPFTLKNLKNGNMYSFKLRADSSTGAVWSKTESIIPLSERTLEPVVKGEYGQIRIVWRDISGADEYNILRSSKETGEYIVIKEKCSYTSFIDLDVEYGKKYYYKIVPSLYTGIVSTQNSAESLSAPPLRVSITGTVDLIKPLSLAVSGGYMYAAAGNQGLKIIDISDPNNLTVKGSLETLNAKDVFLKGDYAYVADGSKGLKVINITEPAEPVQIGSRNTTDAEGIFVDGDYAYIADGEKGLKIIDISNSKYPERVSFISGFNALKVDIKGTYAYIAAGENGLKIIDVSDPSKPEVCGMFFTDNAYDVKVKNNCVYVADGKSGLRIIDISNTKNPNQIAVYKTYNALAVSLYKDYAFVADGSSGLKIIDISKPSKPYLFDSTETNNAVGVAAGKNYVYVADSSGVKMIQTYLYGSSYKIASCNTDGKAYGITVKDNYAFIADHQGGIKIIDISDPARLSDNSIISTFNTDYAEDITIYGNYAFVADGNSGMKIIDISSVFDDSSEANPILTGFCNINGNVQNIAVSGNYAYVAAGGEGLKVVDISPGLDSNSVTQLVITGALKLSDARSIIIQGDYLFLADGNEGLKIINIENPQNPVLYSSLDSSGAKDIAVYKNQVLLAGYSGLKIIDISDLKNPVLKGVSDTMYAEAIVVSDAYAYVADGYRGLKVIDISNPSKPVQVSSCSSTYAVSVDVKGQYAFVVDSSGLKVVQIFIPEWLKHK